MMSGVKHAIRVNGLTMAYGDYVVMRSLDFTVREGEIKIIMGGSGCGKSTLLKHLVGLERAAQGEIFYGQDRFEADALGDGEFQKRFGVLFQSGALWSSMTVEENVAMPMQLYTDLSTSDIRDLVNFKLSLVGLAGFGYRYPSELSGGMKKRAGLARAIALDPKILFFDEPSAGLDPLSSRRLDDLILELRDGIGATVVVVTHELASIFAIADSALFLDAETKSALCDANPKELVSDPTANSKVRNFLLRGEEQAKA